MLRDVVDLRQNKWAPRREENYNPKTIDQIHKEAQLEKVLNRDSPKPSLNDSWITPGKGGKSVPIDQNKLRSMAKVISHHPIKNVST